MIYCSVKGCFSNNKFGETRTFYRFPASSIERASLWQIFCSDETVTPIIHSRRFICDLHFVDSDFLAPDRLHMKRTAVPSVNGPDSMALINFKPKISLLHNELLGTKYSPNGRGILKCFKLSRNEKLKKKISTNKKSQEKITILSPEEISLKIANHSSSEVVSRTEGKTQQTIEESQECIEKPHTIIEICLQALSNCDQDQPQKSKTEEPMPDNEDVSPPSPAQDSYIDLIELDHEEELSSDQSDTKNCISEDKAQVKCLNSPLLTPTQNNESHSFPTVTISNAKSKLLRNQLIKINEFRRKRLVKKYRNTLKKRYFGVLNKSDPRYSIATTAETLGAFKTSFPELLDLVDLDAGGWHKLYTPSVINNFPTLPESYVGSMVNQLRAKLPTLHVRDKLDVSFLLSLMSAYPGAPKYIKELLIQRLNLVYIAIMFKWDTALSLITEADFKIFPTFTKASLHSSYTFAKKTSNTTDSVSNDKSNANSALESNWIDSNDCIALSDMFVSHKKGEKVKPPQVKPPCFKYEIIIHEQNPKTKEPVTDVRPEGVTNNKLGTS